jgi:TPR repeat protein
MTIKLKSIGLLSVSCLLVVSCSTEPIKSPTDAAFSTTNYVPEKSDIAGTTFSRGKEAYKKGDYAMAFKWFSQAAEQGHAAAQKNLGTMYAKGYGVVQNHQEAFKWYRKAAEQGYAMAQFNLGTNYITGEGVTQNAQEAAK